MTTATPSKGIQIQNRISVLQDRLNDLRVEPERYEYEMSQAYDEMIDLEMELDAIDRIESAREDAWQEEQEAR